MSILIKGATMPEDCAHCRYLSCAPKGTDLSAHIEFITERIKNNTGRAYGCPLVEVPAPHGRLIDADALRATNCSSCTLKGDKCLGDDCDWGSIFYIDHAPTIIDAEE